MKRAVESMKSLLPAILSRNRKFAIQFEFSSSSTSEDIGIAVAVAVIVLPTSAVSLFHYPLGISGANAQFIHDDGGYLRGEPNVVENLAFSGHKQFRGLLLLSTLTINKIGMQLWPKD
uniref:Uncharacterized protein n=1 Tax=Glossina pallidipes TaxID=7398 RepID=A0A1B0AH38_GLOPL